MNKDVVMKRRNKGKERYEDSKKGNKSSHNPFKRGRHTILYVLIAQRGKTKTARGFNEREIERNGMIRSAVSAELRRTERDNTRKHNVAWLSSTIKLVIKLINRDIRSEINITHKFLSRTVNDNSIFHKCFLPSARL